MGRFAGTSCVGRGAVYLAADGRRTGPMSLAISCHRSAWMRYLEGSVILLDFSGLGKRRCARSECPVRVALQDRI